MTVPPSTRWKALGVGDFNGDNRTDVFWYNTRTGQTSAWLIDGGSVLEFTNYIKVPSNSGWSVKGFGDFNGDGRTDVFWHNTKTGATSAWLVNGGTVLEFTNYGVMNAAAGWKVKGYGDFNADGRSDVLWHNTKTGEVSAWLLDGSTVRAATDYGSMDPALWKLSGLGDINGDGRTDVLWYNARTRETSAWLLDGNVIIDSPSYGTGARKERIGGSGDFNGDGHYDVFWYNIQSGEASAWLLDSSSVLADTPYMTVPPASGWKVKGYGDFNADGRGDVFWHNTNTGQTSAWLLDGGTIRAFTEYGIVDPRSGWTALFPQAETGQLPSL
jgi:hypothetical protein